MSELLTKLSSIKSRRIDIRHHTTGQRQPSKSRVLWQQKWFLYLNTNLIQAFDVLDDVIEQSQNVMGSLESAISTEESQHYSRRDSARYAGDSRPLPGPSMTTRLAYLIAHLEALSTTLSVLLQTLYTAQSVMWSK